MALCGRILFALSGTGTTDRLTPNTCTALAAKGSRRRDCLPTWVAQDLNTALRGTVAYSDAPEFDLFWLNRLFETSSVEMAFELQHFDSLLPSTSPNYISAAAPHARAIAGGYQHRAGSDVEFLIELYKLLRVD